MSLTTLQRPAPEVPVNLLPPQIQADQRSRRTFGFAVVGAVVLLVLLVAITVIQHMQIGDAEQTLKRSRAEAATLQSKVSSLHQYEALQLSVDQTRQTLATALTNDVAWSRFLDDLDTNIPSDSWLTSLNMTATPGTTPDGELALGTAQYSGVVRTFPGLAHWLDTMNGIKGLHFVYLSNGNKSSNGGASTVTFSATANLTDSMLSGRCQQEDSPCP
jgi:Tfp pilus assembly protein PilN